MTNTTAFSQRPRPVVLCILDGWGDRDNGADNAIFQGATPCWDRFVRTLPMARLKTSAENVGLPAGQMGNSEVGHTNIGAGRVVMQDLPRIDAAVADGTLKDAPALKNLIANLKKSGGVCHVMGLMSPGGVHSHQKHISELARLLSEAGVPVAVHAFLDGRDTPPQSAKGYMADFLRDIEGLSGVAIATVSGRYYAMDRDARWQRVEKAYRAIAGGQGIAAADPLTAIAASYAAGDNDEFMLPSVIGGYSGMKDDDGVLMANFRADRAREILTALADPGFDAFATPERVRLAATAGMVEYSEDLNRFYPALFSSVPLDNILGQRVAEAGCTQLRIAETEKYAHVTFFFNGGREQVFPGEDRILVPSPKVATYDLKPEMSAIEVTDRLVAAIEGGDYDLIIANYANGDMVGHTGILDAAIKAAETVDACLARLESAIEVAGGVMLVTADHGNCEMMSDPATGQPHTAHTLNRVPVVLVNSKFQSLHDGVLADIAPTILQLMDLPQPAEMTGRSLIDGDGVQIAAAQ
ncbi:MAG: 2,3-bisphosphoglycerate-independent phosphoglycerate mutase [Rhodospirillales bacterium]|nr:2,3-bisphosphoglycerate-independent phosphoglycerate mutase [Rhodospirillales bacterium]